MKHIFINLSPSQGRGKNSTFENFFLQNSKQNISFLMKHICSVLKQNIFLREYVVKPTLSDLGTTPNILLISVREFTVTVSLLGNFFAEERYTLEELSNLLKIYI